jgi:hypothetical protein
MVIITNFNSTYVYKFWKFYKIVTLASGLRAIGMATIAAEDHLLRSDAVRPDPHQVFIFRDETFLDTFLS